MRRPSPKKIVLLLLLAVAVAAGVAAVRKWMGGRPPEAEYSIRFPDRPRNNQTNEFVTESESSRRHLAEGLSGATRVWFPLKWVVIGGGYTTARGDGFALFDDGGGRVVFKYDGWYYRMRWTVPMLEEFLEKECTPQPPVPFRRPAPPSAPG